MFIVRPVHRIWPRSGLRQTKRLITGKSSLPGSGGTGGVQLPFADDLTTDNSQLLEYYPNLEGFIGTAAADETSAAREDNIHTIPAFESTDQKRIEPVLANSPQVTKNYTEEEFQDLQDLTNISNMIQSPVLTNIDVGLFENFRTKLHSNDTNPSPRNIDLSRISQLTKPISIISKFNDPHLNLAIEYYIYDNMPVSDSIYRLIFYKNKPCVVFGKNQNPFKEINMHYANITSTPVLRRLSGGGTVVHDLGNMNFSFMAKKSKFDRTNFTDLCIKDLNSLVLNEPINIGTTSIQLPSTTLDTISKGDIINKYNAKKISGSAYKLSRGKFIHHGTMLLNSELSMLRKLLKLTPERKASIIANGTDSIPSSVENYQIDEDLFLYSMINTYETNFLEQKQGDEVYVVDDYSCLPQDVVDRAKELTHWSWVFGKTPSFTHTLHHDQFDLCVEVEKFHVKDFYVVSKDNSNAEDIETALLSSLRKATKETKVRYVGNEVTKYITDPILANWICWQIDHNCNYRNLGIDMNK